MKLQLVPLGINGYFPSYGRQTASYLLLTGGQALLLDAGSGVSRLMEPDIQQALESYDRLDVVLSHYHLDHVTGFFCLPSVWKRGPIRLFAPTRPFLDADPLPALGRMLGPPFASGLEGHLADLEVIPVDREELRIGSLDFRFWLQEHPGGSLGIRIGDLLAYATDKATRAGDEEHVRGVKLLLHELWLTNQEAAEDPDQLRGHSRLSDVAELVRVAEVGAVMPIHQNPQRDPEEVEALCVELERAASCPVVRPVEGCFYDVG